MDDIPRNADEAKRVHRSVETLLVDVRRELARIRHCGERHLSAEVAHVLSGFGLELVDVVRYALRGIARDQQRHAPTDGEVAVIVAAARQFVALAVELERQDEVARARALGDRVTSPAAPAGAFRASERPVRPHYKGVPRVPGSGVHEAPTAPFGDPSEAKTPVGLGVVDERPTPVRPRRRC